MDTKKRCFHCGDEFDNRNEIILEDKSFCCIGCKTVYEIFSKNDLTLYYDFQQNPGASPQLSEGKFNFLDNTDIVTKLIDFDEDGKQIVTLYIPHIHCSSCIWILENLNKLLDGVIFSTVNFPQKKVRITYLKDKVTLKKIVELLSSVGYEPYISLDNYQKKKPKLDRGLIYKLGIAFFCYGNVMLLSFPEYFGVEDAWLDNYKPFFRWLIFGLSLPSFFYSASIYHKAAYLSIKNKTFDINIPMSLGLIMMFVRSTVDIVFNLGPGFFDSLTSLVFLMLVGKLFQQKTYDYLSFERDYKSYFPVAVTKLNDDKSEISVAVYDVNEADKLVIRNNELIPVDALLLSDEAHIDYSFVTGEALPVKKVKGEKIYAGGKQVGGLIEVQVLNSISQSYLTQLWDNEVFNKDSKQSYTNLITKVSHYFTPVLLSVALLGFFYWIFIDATIAFNVITAVLIIACPCALALTTPFTLGNVIRIFGNKKFYLKNATVIEQLSAIDTIVFDKTGTITSGNSKTDINYSGKPLSQEAKSHIKSIVHYSNHPLSRKLFNFLSSKITDQVEDYKEIIGKGLEAKIGVYHYKIGSASFVGYNEFKNNQTEVHVSVNNEYQGKFLFSTTYRDGLKELFAELNKKYDLRILSGDNNGDQESLEKILPKNVQMIFNQKPDDKLNYIKKLQDQGKNVLMIGDGLNDAGALAQSNVGISISEDVNVFSPACDAILDASRFKELSSFLKMSIKSIKIIKISFLLSLCYNLIGISFALSGVLSPLFAAILMPISTVTIIGFVTIASNFQAKRILK